MNTRNIIDTEEHQNKKALMKSRTFCRMYHINEKLYIHNKETGKLWLYKQN